MLVGGVAVIAFMWFGVPTITNGRPNISGELAKLSPRALHSNRLGGTIGRFHELEYLPVWIAASGDRGATRLFAAAGSCWRWRSARRGGWWSRSRSRTTAGRRFRATCSRRRRWRRVVAGVGVGWLLLEAAAVGRRPALGRRRGRRGARRGPRPGALIPRADRAPGPDATSAAARTRSRCCRARRLDWGVRRHILRCGQPVTDVGYVSTAGVALPRRRRLGRRPSAGRREGGAARPGHPEGADQAAVPGRVERRAVAHAALAGGPLRGAPRHLYGSGALIPRGSAWRRPSNG